MKKLLLILSVAIIFNACSGDCYQADKLNSSYEINKGKSIELSFNYNSSSGFTWTWVNEKENAHLKLNKHEQHQCGAGTGAKGVESFTFEGINLGNDSIVMKHWQTWDSTSTKETKVIYVTVK